jgi:hypothetical protein
MAAVETGLPIGRILRSLMYLPEENATADAKFWMWRRSYPIAGSTSDQTDGELLMEKRIERRRVYVTESIPL